MEVNLFSKYLHSRYGNYIQTPTSRLECHMALRDAQWHRKLERIKALAKINLEIARKERAKKERIQAKVETDMEIRRKRKRIADIKFRLSQIKGEAQHLEEELDRLDKGKQKEVVATPKLPKEKIITAPQKEALEKESFHQNKKEDQSKEKAGSSTQEGEDEAEKWSKELADLDKTILLEHLNGKIPDMELLTIIKRRIQGPEVFKWTKQKYEWAIEY